MNKLIKIRIIMPKSITIGILNMYFVSVNQITEDEHR